MTFEYAFFGLLIFSTYREIFFMRQIQKLVDKLMCKNLHEYQQAIKIGKIERGKPTPADSDDLEEDLAALQGII